MFELFNKNILNNDYNYNYSKSNNSNNDIQ